MRVEMDDRYPIEIANILQKSILLLIFIRHSLVLIQADYSTLRFANFFLVKIDIGRILQSPTSTPSPALKVKPVHIATSNHLEK
jgi:hypothetical protein